MVQVTDATSLTAGSAALFFVRALIGRLDARRLTADTGEHHCACVFSPTRRRPVPPFVWRPCVSVQATWLASARARTPPSPAAPPPVRSKVLLSTTTRIRHSFGTKTSLPVSVCCLWQHDLMRGLGHWLGALSPQHSRRETAPALFPNAVNPHCADLRSGSGMKMTRKTGSVTPKTSWRQASSAAAGCP